jgi:excisionase family DNA binding protein
MITTEPKNLTVKEAAGRMRLSAASVYALCATKKLRHTRVGVGRGKIIIEPGAIVEYLAKGTVSVVSDGPTRPTGNQGRTRPFTHLDSERLLEAWKEQGAVPT